MVFERFKTPAIASIAYLVGDAESGKAFVVDPGRAVADILATARSNKLTITHVVETHRQEDFVIGAAPLAEATGAKIVVGRDKHFGHGDIRLDDGEELEVGSLRLRALHTPGHTPESMCYALYLADIGDLAWGVFTGDTLFIGTAGRTDLPDPLRTSEAAGELYDAARDKLLPLGDQCLIFPAHGSGSVCGGQIADRDDSSIGLERHTNPVFTLSREEFVRSKVEERIPRPPYFAHMERVNAKGGMPPGPGPDEVAVLQPADFATDSRQGVVIDTRSPEAFAAGHLPGSYGIWADGLVIFAPWVADAGTAIYLVLHRPDDPAAFKEALAALACVGLDHVKGTLAGGFEAWRDAGMPIERLATTTPADLLDRGARVLDVREDTEFEEEGHIPGAAHLFVGYVERQDDRLAELLDKDAPVVVTCAVGHRAGVAASMLKRLGYPHVENLLGGVTAWAKLDQPMEHGPGAASVTTPDVEGERR